MLQSLKVKGSGGQKVLRETVERPFRLLVVCTHGTGTCLKRFVRLRQAEFGQSEQARWRREQSRKEDSCGANFSGCPLRCICAGVVISLFPHTPAGEKNKAKAAMHGVICVLKRPLIFVRN